MKLITMDEQTFEISVDPEALMINEFAVLFHRDKNKDKRDALAELSYIWFMIDIRSDFASIIDIEERKREVIQSIPGLGKDWQPDLAVTEAYKKYEQLSITVMHRMYNDAKEALDNMSKHIKVASSDLDRYDITKLQKYISDLPKMLETMKTLEENVLKEKETIGKHRGSQSKSLMEDGDD